MSVFSRNNTLLLESRNYYRLSSSTPPLNMFRFCPSQSYVMIIYTHEVLSLPNTVTAETIGGTIYECIPNPNMNTTPISLRLLRKSTHDICKIHVMLILNICEGETSPMIRLCYGNTLMESCSDEYIFGKMVVCNFTLVDEYRENKELRAICSQHIFKCVHGYVHIENVVQTTPKYTKHLLNDSFHFDMNPSPVSLPMPFYSVHPHAVHDYNIYSGYQYGNKIYLVPVEINMCCIAGDKVTVEIEYQGSATLGYLGKQWSGKENIRDECIFDGNIFEIECRGKVVQFLLVMHKKNEYISGGYCIDNVSKSHLIAYHQNKLYIAGGYAYKLFVEYEDKDSELSLRGTTSYDYSFPRSKTFFCFLFPMHDDSYILETSKCSYTLTAIPSFCFMDYSGVPRNYRFYGIQKKPFIISEHGILNHVYVQIMLTIDSAYHTTTVVRFGGIDMKEIVVMKGKHTYNIEKHIEMSCDNFECDQDIIQGYILVCGK